MESVPKGDDPITCCGCVKEREVRQPHVLDIVLAHGLYQVHGTDHIMGVVQHGVVHALANGLPPSEMNDRVEPEAARIKDLGYRTRGRVAFPHQMKACPCPYAQVW